MRGEPITRDFFLPPGSPRLTGAYADDRVLVFARDDRSLYVSWDLRPATFGEGPAELVVVDLRGRVLAAQPAPGPQGARFPDALPTGEVVRAELRRGPATLARSRWLSLPGRPKPEVAPPARATKARRPGRRRAQSPAAQAPQRAEHGGPAAAQADAPRAALRDWPHSAAEWPSSRS